MAVFTRGFGGRRPDSERPVPPGQYLTDDFPVLSIGPTPNVDTSTWQLTIRTEEGAEHRWDWAALQALPAEDVTVDIHCVTRWSKQDTHWRGVPVDAFFADVETAAEYVVAHSFGGYTTNLPLDDLLDGRAWVVTEYEGEPLEPLHGGPVRLLVPHLYLWKSAKWLRALTLHLDDEPGFWEQNGYHLYGDPWSEQRYG
ncbi:sulfite oxidase-like oxidoreductase [Isoptericola chiayiensis]|uniref:Sulfite oxidase-like oxidoreductase n=1 Tax=Isoptericola chiayiensis TaxID=579446 RepID=A0ABP8XXT7_9MICO|nr:molybdopterin-dependent oxidoreductase [Isoptericola chiayiensis]NOW02170.1 DMSO/TMAO reductase YedYZ molybdopterin-dependent catalytic subunit [Isoptericola chiayiensis]